MRREATLVSVDTAGHAVVELDPVSQCLRCSRGQGCGAAIAGAFGVAGEQGVRLTIQQADSARFKAQQKVLVEIDEQGSGWLMAVFGAYGLPLAGLLMASALATAFIESGMSHLSPGLKDLLVLLSAIAGLGGGIFASRTLESHVLACAGRSLCLQSARIVGTCPLAE